MTSSSSASKHHKVGITETGNSNNKMDRLRVRSYKAARSFSKKKEEKKKIGELECERG